MILLVQRSILAIFGRLCVQFNNQSVDRARLVLTNSEVESINSEHDIDIYSYNL